MKISPHPPLDRLQNFFILIKVLLDNNNYLSIFVTMENKHQEADSNSATLYESHCDEARILQFLADIKVNNNRDWFHENRNRFDEVHAAFEQIVERLIAALTTFDPEISTVTVKSTLYRFYRDTRFSLDKSPYKRHFGSYINPRGKKSPHGGYYLHLEPGNCLIGGGAYCLESPILKAVRKSIVDDIDQFRAIVEAPRFHELFPVIGDEHLKTMPAGFPRDFAYPQYLRPKNFAVMHRLPDDFFFQEDWITKAAQDFKVMKPFLDFVNETIDDYIR